MRKTLPIIAFLLSVALQVCAQQKNYDFQEGKLFYKITDATKQYVQVTTEMDELVEATGTLYNNPIEGDITIPANINHQGKQYTVTGIADNSFGGCNKVTSVSIPASVTEFGEQVFLSCTGMKYITVDKDNSVLKDIDGVLFDQYSVNFYAASASKLNISLILSLFNVVFGFFSNTSIIRCT